MPLNVTRGRQYLGSSELIARVPHGTSFQYVETLSRLTPIMFEDDFGGPRTFDLVSGNVDATGVWEQVYVLTAGAPAVAMHDVEACGCVSLYEDGATNEAQAAGLHFGDNRQFGISNTLVYEAAIHFPTAPGALVEAWWGLIGDYAAGPIGAAGPAEHILFVADGNSNVVIYADDTVHDYDAVATGFTVPGFGGGATYPHFRIDFADITDVQFYINGSRVAAGTTFDMSAVPALQVQPILYIEKSGGVAGSALDCDYVRIWQER